MGRDSSAVLEVRAIRRLWRKAFISQSPSILQQMQKRLGSGALVFSGGARIDAFEYTHGMELFEVEPAAQVALIDRFDKACEIDGKIVQGGKRVAFCEKHQHVCYFAFLVHVDQDVLVVQRGYREDEVECPVFVPQRHAFPELWILHGGLEEQHVLAYR